MFARAFLRSTIAIAFLLLTLPASAADSDTQQIRALLMDRVHKFNLRDIPGQMKAFADTGDVFVFNIVPPQQYSRKAYQDDLASLYRMFKVPATMDVQELAIGTGTGDVAYSTCLLHLAGKRKDGGLTDINMRTTTVYRKIAGKWLIVHEHSSVPVDTESGQISYKAKKGN